MKKYIGFLCLTFVATGCVNPTLKGTLVLNGADPVSLVDRKGKTHTLQSGDLTLKFKDPLFSDPRLEVRQSGKFEVQLTKKNLKWIDRVLDSTDRVSARIPGQEINQSVDLQIEAQLPEILRVYIRRSNEPCFAAVSDSPPRPRPDPLPRRRVRQVREEITVYQRDIAVDFERQDRMNLGSFSTEIEYERVTDVRRDPFCH